MTFAASATSATNGRNSLRSEFCVIGARSRRGGFTLIELLVVIGIILVLAGVLLPMLARTMRQGRRMRTAADLNAIGVALDAYKGDFGDYPRISYTATVPYNGTGSGAALLCKALIGLGDNVTQDYVSTKVYFSGQVVKSGTTEYAAIQQVPTGAAPPNATYWTEIPLPGADGADGAGFRLRPGVPPGSPATGQVRPAYLQPDKFKVVGMAIVDADSNPILYYVANPVKPNIAMNNGSLTSGTYIGVPPGVTPGASPAGQPLPSVSLYNYSDNDTQALVSAGKTDYKIAFADLSVIEAMLGDYQLTGYIASGETANTTAPFILWSAGADGYFGPVNPAVDPLAANFKSSALTAADRKKLVARCDDVTNFSFAQ